MDTRSVEWDLSAGKVDVWATCYSADEVQLLINSLEVACAAMRQHAAIKNISTAAVGAPGAIKK